MSYGKKSQSRGSTIQECRMCAANRAPSGALQAAATAAEAEEKKFRDVLLKIGSNLKLLGLRPSIDPSIASSLSS
jgi:hypothetical protein